MWLVVTGIFPCVESVPFRRFFLIIPPSPNLLKNSQAHSRQGRVPRDDTLFHGAARKTQKRGKAGYAIGNRNKPQRDGAQERRRL